MSASRGNLELILRRRHLVAAFCVLTLPAVGCMKDRPVSTTEDAIQQQASARVEAPGLGDYIRSVFKLSQQGPPEAASELDRLHQAKPELGALAEQIGMEPGNVEARRSLAAAYLEEGLLTEAFRLLEELRAVGTTSASLESGLAEIWDRWGNFPLAHRHASAALELEADNSNNWALMGRIQLHRGEFESAGAAFGKALELGDGEDAYLLANLGYVYFKRGQWSLARPFLESALSLDDSLIEVHNNLGITLANLHEDELALDHFRAVADDQVAYNNLGVVQMERGDWVLAHSAFRQALTIDPDYGKAAFNLAEAESFLPAPTVIDVGSFGGSAPVTVATVAAPPREASATQLALLPASGTLDLPEWPRVYLPWAAPEVTLATSQAVRLAGMATAEPAVLPIQRDRSSWSAYAMVRPVSLEIRRAADESLPIIVDDSALSAAAQKPLEFGFDKQLAVAAETRVTEPTREEVEMASPAAAEAEVSEPQQVLARDEPMSTPSSETVEAVATVEDDPVDPTPPSAPVAVTEPVARESRAAVIQKETKAVEIVETEAALEENDERAVVEAASSAMPVASAALTTDLPPVETGSPAGRLMALLAIVGLGVAAGSLTAGRFWGLVGGLVGALAAAFTTLLRG